MIDYEHRYREAMTYAQKAEVEIRKLRYEVKELTQAAESMKIIAEEAISALEYLGKGYQA